MSNFKCAAAGLAGLAVLASMGAGSQAQNQKFVTIGTGGVTGVYYAVGGAVCRLLNKERKSHGIRCSVEITGGSAFNVNTIKAGELDFGLSQSDVSTTPTKAWGSSRMQAPTRTCARCIQCTRSPSPSSRVRRSTLRSSRT